jgi:hypothetical protein
MLGAGIHEQGNRIKEFEVGYEKRLLMTPKPLEMIRRKKPAWVPEGI